MHTTVTCASYNCSTTLVCIENCVDDSQCQDEQVCYNGECIKCTNDYHCSEGKKCHQNECKKSCHENNDCHSFKNKKFVLPFYCHIDHKVCLEACHSDTDCESGYRCYKGQCHQSCNEENKCLAPGQYCHKYDLNVLFINTVNSNLRPLLE